MTNHSENHVKNTYLIGFTVKLIKKTKGKKIATKINVLALIHIRI